MENRNNKQDATDLIEELDAKVQDLKARSQAATNVVRTIATFMQDGGEIPRDLAMSIGGCLIEYMDSNGNCSDPNIQLLSKEIDKMMNW